ncbi:MAG: hypothetical protein EOM12_10755 [Verrucomicrobiae bacterium]|nr:hypothetical protein [Verrucomicrobiae bacterium]
MMQATQDDQLWEEAADVYIGEGLTQRSFKRLSRRFGKQLRAWAEHLPSREDILIEIVKKHVGGMEELRVTALNQARKRAEGNPIPVEEIIDARLLPVAECAIESIMKGGRFQRGLSRLFSETPSFKRRLLADVFPASTRHFLKEFERSLPSLCSEEIEERFWMSHSSILGALGMLDKHHDPASPTRGEQAILG